MVRLLRKLRNVTWLLLSALVCAQAVPAESGVVARWGNAEYVDLAVGESFVFQDRRVILVSTQANYCKVAVDDVVKELIVARRSLPKVVNGVRIFVALNRAVAELTPKNTGHEHGLMRKDALLCLSDTALPLLDPGQYTFPVSRQDGYRWSMEEGSHMFAYLGWAAHKKGYRSHEGIDLNMHEARGKRIHPLVAVEDGEIVMAVGPEATGDENEGCIIIRSKSQPKIYYVYKHMHDRSMMVKHGQSVEAGEVLGYIWGDWKWGHLHFAVVCREKSAEYEQRYHNLLNCFGQLFELWHGDLQPHRARRTKGEFRFDQRYWIGGYSSAAYTYDELVGYGWQMGRWCAAGRIEGNNEPNGRLRKILHQGTPAEAINPNDYYDFEVDVELGRYSVSLKLGDEEYDTWQRIEIEGVNIGSYPVAVNKLRWTQHKEVFVKDGQLTIRFYVKGDNSRYATVKRIHFAIVRD